MARLCAQGGKLSNSIGLSHDISPAPWAEGFRIGRHGHRLHRQSEPVPRFRPFLCSNSARDGHREQVSTLFWINMLVGLVLWHFFSGHGARDRSFYHEPRLVWVTIVLAFGFVFNAAGVQHSAILMREMRFTALAAINTISLLVGALIAIAGAKMGYGYWALVAMTVTYAARKHHRFLDRDSLGSWNATPADRNTL